MTAGLAMGEPARATGLRTVTIALATGALAGCPPVALACAAPGWVAEALGPNASGTLFAGGIAGGCVTAGTVALVRVAVHASQRRFLAAFSGTSLAALAGLGVAAVWPGLGPGGRPGLLVGYGAALVLGKLLEVPAIWRAA